MIGLPIDSFKVTKSKEVVRIVDYYCFEDILENIQVEINSVLEAVKTILASIIAYFSLHKELKASAFRSRNFTIITCKAFTIAFFKLEVGLVSLLRTNFFGYFTRHTIKLESCLAYNPRFKALVNRIWAIAVVTTVTKVVISSQCYFELIVKFINFDES